MKEAIFGVTLIFNINEQPSVVGVLKSIVLKAKKNDIDSAIDHLSKRISDFYNYSYIGLYDIFLVSGDLREGEILGRTTYYEYDNLKLAKSLVSSKFSIENDSKFNVVNCSLIFLCDNTKGEKFTMSIITILNANDKSFIEKAKDVATSNMFMSKVKKYSIEKINNLSYIGINNIGEVDLKFNTFQTFYSSFDNLNILKGEIITQREKKSKLKDILLTHDIVY